MTFVNYLVIYLSIITVYTFYQLSLYTAQKSSIIIKHNQFWSAFGITMFMILFIGLRPISPEFGDMMWYSDSMLNHRFEGLENTWDSNFIFQPMMAFLSSHGASERTPILILAAINFGATFFAIRKFFPEDIMIAMLVFLGALSTFGGAVNGLKAGCAGALFLLALAYRSNKILCVLFLVISLGFHHAMQLPIVVFIICLFVKNTKLFLGIWFLCLLMAMMHVTFFMNIFGDWTDDHGAEYLYTLAGSKDSYFSGKTGFRLDFVLYSFVPIAIGWYAYWKRLTLSEEYTCLLNLYILTNAIWLLCMYAQFTNRIAALSWGLYPVLIIYPFLKNEWESNNYKWFYYLVIGHLLFTISLSIITYGN